MQIASWPVDDGQRSATLTLDHDEQSGRLFVRVDGRAVASPLQPHEEERTVRWSGQTYRLLRVRGEWDMEFVPGPPEVPRSPAKATAAPSRPPLMKASGVSFSSVVSTLLIGLLLAAGVGVWKYMHRWTGSWVEYKPADSRFEVSFPSQPSKRDAGRTFTLLNENREMKQTFEFSYAQAPVVLETQQADAILNSAIDRYISRVKAKLTKKETGYFARHDATFFEADQPKSDGFPDGSHVRAVAIYQANRIYVAAFTSERDQANAPEALRFFGAIRIGEYVAPPQ